MPSFITESFLYKIFDKILINSYKSSLLKKNIDKFILCFKNSFLYKSFERYIWKSPYFLNSFSYKVFRKFIKFIDKIMDWFNKLFGKLIKNSLIYKETFDIKKMEINKKFLITSTLIFSLALGNSLGNLIFKTSSNIIVSNSLFALGFAFYIAGVIPKLYRESFIFKCIKYIFKLVKL